MLPQERQPLETVQLVGTQLRLKATRRRRLADPADPAQREQSLYLLLPHPGLAHHDAERRQLVPQPGLEPADPQPVAGNVLQLPGLPDQLGQPPQFGLVQAEVRAVGQQQVRLPQGERGEHVGERDRAALGQDRDPEIEPVDLTRDLGRGDADAQRIADLPVVGDVAGHLDAHPGLAGQQRQQLGGEAHGFQAAEPGTGDHVLGDPAEPEAVQERLLGRKVAVPGIARGLVQPGPEVRLADLVRPLPVEEDLVAVAVRRTQHQGRVRDGRRGEGTIGGDHRGRLLQPRVELVPEPGLAVGGHLEPLPAQRHLLQPRGNAPPEPGQAEAPAGWVLAPLRLVPVQVDHPVTPGADEPQRDDGGLAPGSVDADRRGDGEGSAGLGPGDVEAELRLPVPLQRTELAAIHELQPGLLRLVEQRPEPARVHRGQLDRAVPAVGGVVKAAVGPRPVEAEQLPQQLELLGRVGGMVSVAVELGPVQRAGDPAAVLARLDQAGYQAQSRARRRRHGPAVLGHQGQLDGQRRLRLPPGLRAGRQPRFQRRVPRRRAPCLARDGRHARRGLHAALEGRNEQRGGVLAAMAGSAAAVHAEDLRAAAPGRRRSPGCSSRRGCPARCRTTRGARRPTSAGRRRGAARTPAPRRSYRSR